MKPRNLKTIKDRRQMMDQAMKHIAKIHARIDSPDWVAHQIYRFLFEGYPHHTKPLMSKLEKLAGDSILVKGLRLVLQAEDKNPTPFSALIPKAQLFKD